MVVNALVVFVDLALYAYCLAGRPIQAHQSLLHLGKRYKFECWCATLGLSNRARTNSHSCCLSHFSSRSIFDFLCHYLHDCKLVLIVRTDDCDTRVSINPHTDKVLVNTKDLTGDATLCFDPISNLDFSVCCFEYHFVHLTHQEGNHQNVDRPMACHNIGICLLLCWLSE